MISVISICIRSIFIPTPLPRCLLLAHAVVRVIILSHLRSTVDGEGSKPCGHHTLKRKEITPPSALALASHPLTTTVVPDPSTSSEPLPCLPDTAHASLPRPRPRLHLLQRQFVSPLPKLHSLSCSMPHVPELPSG